MNRTRLVVPSVVIPVVLLSGVILVGSPETRLWLLVGATGMVAVAAGYFTWSLGTDLRRELEDDA